jgi:phenylpropionate dioxygenase-like ring-hydroxylating dioxygenase large terminal subunit
MVGTRRDLARPGDFLTLNLCGEPVLVRNEGGELVAFQNVCAHRHCKIRSEPRGNQARLACQNHGWEYTREGRTGRIPGAVFFKPWKGDDRRLLSLRVATAGELVMVSLAPDGPSLREHLGPAYASWESSFDGEEFRLADVWEHTFDCNWKVVVENSLEAYHIPVVHPLTFRTMPDAAGSEHVLDARYTALSTALPRDPRARAQGWIARALGVPATGRYVHQNIHPNATFSSFDLVRLAMIVYPLGPRRCRYRFCLYTARGRRWGPVAAGLALALKTFSRRFFRRVYWEDGRLYGAIQEGLDASEHPGVLGSVEERVYAFQRYVRETVEAGAQNR